MVYEAQIADLEAGETQRAVESLISTAERLPTIAQLRAEVMRERAARNTAPQAVPALPRTQVGRSEWVATLNRMLDDQARYERMARAWYKAKGQTYPGDPGAARVRDAASGADGNPVPFAVER
jgi:hypothetical protein